jgi:hypothetical protein
MSSGRKRRKRWGKSTATSRRGRQRPTRQEKLKRIVRYFDWTAREVQHCPSVAYLDVTPDTTIAASGSFGRLRITASLHSGRFVTIEEDLADRRVHLDLPGVAPGLYLRKFVYSVWDADQRVIAFHCDRTHRREENPTFPYHRHTGEGDAEPLEANDPKTLTEFLLRIRRL